MLRSSEIGLVMPAYNSQAFIADAIRAIQKQTFSDFECVIVDDGSTDATRALAEELTADDPRFTVIHQSNRGVPAARNAGLAALAALSPTKYVTFPDSDDMLYPDGLEVLYKAAEDRPDTVGAHALAEQVDKDGNVLPDEPFAAMGRARLVAAGRGRIRTLPLESDSTFASIIQTFTMYPTSASLIRRAALEQLGPDPYDTAIKIYDDWDVFIRLARFGNFTFTNNVVMKYRQHGNNITLTTDVQTVWNDNRAVRLKTARSPENSAAQRAALVRAWRAAEAKNARDHAHRLGQALGQRNPRGATHFLAHLCVASARSLIGRPTPLDKPPDQSGAARRP